MRSLAQASGARAITLVIGLVCGLITTRLLVADASIADYALYTLVISIPALLPFLDFGSGAALVNKLAAGERAPAVLQPLMTSMARVVLVSALVISLVAVALTVGNVWTPILGNVRAEHLDSVLLLATLAFAVSLPLGLGQRVLLGTQKLYLQVLVQGFQPPLTLAFIFAGIHFLPPTHYSYLALGYLFALVITNGIAFIVGDKVVAGTLVAALNQALRTPFRRGVTVMDLGLPITVQLLAPPLANQLDRLILAHVVPSADIAVYGIATQMFGPVQGLISMAGISLWPVLMKLEHGRESRALRLSPIFGGAALLLGALVILVSPLVYQWLSRGSLHSDFALLSAMAVAAAVQSALYPLGMSLMDLAGARFQVLPTLLMCLVNVALSVLLANLVGLPGPAIATAISIFTCQWLPFRLRVGRKRNYNS